MVNSIEVVSALTWCALLPSVFNLKAAQINLQRSLIRKPMAYEFELGHNATDETKNICCATDEDAVDPSTVTIRSPAFWLCRLAFVPDGWSKPRVDSGPNRPPASAGQPSGGRAAFQIRLHALYSTRPHGLVQAKCWHTCPDLDLGPWYGLTH